MRKNNFLVCFRLNSSKYILCTILNCGKIIKWIENTKMISLLKGTEVEERENINASDGMGKGI